MVRQVIQIRPHLAVAAAASCQDGSSIGVHNHLGLQWSCACKAGNSMLVVLCLRCAEYDPKLWCMFRIAGLLQGVVPPLP